MNKVKQDIISLIKDSADFDYLVAVLSFADNYPDNSRAEKVEVPV